MNYSFTDFVKMSYYLVMTKLCFPKARLIRRPIHIRGKKGIVYGAGLTTGHGCRLDVGADKAVMRFGKDARLGDYVHINACREVVIGDNVLMASKIFISDTSHGRYKGENPVRPDTNPSERELVCDPVHIGDNVWIGENVVILPGTTVGSGCVIGANAVLTGGTFPDNCIIVGSPARIVKQYDEELQQWVRYERC